MASASTLTYQDALDSQYLSNSISSLSRSRTTNTLIVRAYKQATQLYLTKRFKEAYETLEPILSPQPVNGNRESKNGRLASGAALVAQCSRSTRTKVWVFYLSLLHAIIELGAEEGKTTFGSTKWRQLAAKAREGTVWDEIIQCGYGGNEGDVDPDVVVNLATLLLGHMQTQALNQQRMETYLSASADAAHMAMLQDGTATPMSNGTSSPKELTTRLKILELYTLHILPANDEWDYAQQFIDLSDMLDEERREAFLHALESLKEEKDGAAERERELEELREREMEEQRAVVQAKQEEEERKEAERKKVVEAEKARAPIPPTAGSRSRTSNGGKSTQKPTSKPPSKPPRKPQPPLPRNLYARASLMFNSLQQMILQAGRNIAGNNIAIMRLLIFVFAFLVLIARRGVRIRVRRALEDSWVKVKQTVGMGVKVSYI